MADETHVRTSGVVVCARCGAHGDHMHSHVWRLGDGEHRLIFWFCARCLGCAHDATSVAGV